MTRQNKVSDAPRDDTGKLHAAENDAACSAHKVPRGVDSQNSPGISVSKHSSAVAMAVDLASTSSWSDLFSPSAASSVEDMRLNLATSQDLNHHRSVALEHTDLGPPPDYTPSDDHNLTPTDDTGSEHTPHFVSQSGVITSAGSMSDPEALDSQEDLDAPLLGESSEKTPKSHGPWMRVPSITAFQPHRMRWVHAAIGILVTLYIGVPLVYSLVCLTCRHHTM